MLNVQMYYSRFLSFDFCLTKLPGGSDYKQLSKFLSFNKMDPKIHIENVPIVNDNRAEHIETFFAHLKLDSTPDESDPVLLSPDSTEVRIKDDDSKNTSLHQYFTFN